MMDKIDELALEVSAESSKETNANLVVLSTGVTIRVKPVSNILFTEFQKKHPQPKVPMWYNEDNGRNEPNPNNPDYIEANRAWQFDVGIGIVDLMIIMGTSLESVKDGTPKLEDDDWLEDLSFADVEVDRNNKRARWLAYVKYVAAAKDEDMEKLMAHVSGQSGVSEADVETASSQFRDKK
jgi:hypothetical protein